MTEKLRQAAQQALKALENVRDYRIEESLYDDITALRNALAEPEQKPVALDQIEQYRWQMAAISTAAMGYWKKGDGILPDYDTPALRDVADLYAKYELLVAQPKQKREWQRLTDEDVRDLWSWSMTAEAERTANTQQHAFALAVAAKIKEKNTRYTPKKLLSMLFKSKRKRNDFQN